MSDAASELSFEHATYEAKGSASPGEAHRPPCSSCNGPLGDEYWKLHSHVVCAGCSTRFEATMASSQSKASFGKAALLGGGTALGCGILYAIFVAFTGVQLALVTIFIAYLVAKVIRKCSSGIGGRRYQILAVALTYMASSMGYAPAIFDELGSSQTEQAAVSTTTEKKAEAQASSAPDSAKSTNPMSGSEVALGAAFCFALVLAAPVLAAFEAPIGLLIVAFGLWEAWKRSAAVPLALEGPFRVASVPETAPVG